VLARVLDIDWVAASRLATETDGVPAVVTLPADQLVRLAEILSVEVSNRRDAGARWLSAMLLGHVRDLAPVMVDQAVRRARDQERSAELRAQSDRLRRWFTSNCRRSQLPAAGRTALRRVRCWPESAH
jgi:hypothetical protein